VTANVGSILSVALGVHIDLDITTQLLCSLVSGTFSGQSYDMGCTCLGSDGGILLDVNVDVEAIVNVVGLEPWVQAQVSSIQSTRRERQADERAIDPLGGFEAWYPRVVQPTCVGDGAFMCPFGQKKKKDGVGFLSV